jgi:hypothetical protein
VAGVLGWEELWVYPGWGLEIRRLNLGIFVCMRDEEEVDARGVWRWSLLRLLALSWPWLWLRCDGGGRRWWRLWLRHLGGNC